MVLSDVLTEDNIIIDLKAREKAGILDEMARGVASKVFGLDKGRLLQAVLDREKLGTTGIGHGVAIPHGKIKGLAEIKVFFGRSLSGVDFNSIDGAPVHLFFMIIAPQSAAVTHLKILAGISQMLKNQECRTRLMRAENPSDVFRIIVEADRRNVGA
ncbi:MAG: PTS sugar transporter subunit IIA [Deltaproteobacteria bacterium]|nr:PTS sugar transporter subunit IIA [Deltaproteobacteria bacterium]